MICFISAPTVAEFEGTVRTRGQAARLKPYYPPLGILSLAAVLQQKNIQVRLFDLNRLFLEWISNQDSNRESKFFPVAVRELLSVRADVYGFGTISSSYPLTVRLAREVRRAYPQALILFGGPQASSVDLETLEAFPFVDAVIRGEAEESLPEVLTNGFGNIGGVTFRGNGRLVRSPDPTSAIDLDRLPAPAYHLWPGVKECAAIPLEIGRGCPFACTFCSTSRFFRRRFRLKSPNRLIEQMKSLQQAYGSRPFHFVHDSFTAVRARAVEFCEALLECGGGYTWTSSARTDCMDEELLDLMARAGCTGIFFGIETGSSRVQQVIGKGLDLGHAVAILRCAGKHKMRADISLIAAFPDETPEDLRATVEFIMDSMRLDHVEPQFHLLAPLAGTAIHREFQDRLQWDGIFSDMAFQGWRQDPDDCTLIREHPEIFPNFYAAPTQLDRAWLMELRNFLMYGMARYRWLLVALHRHSGILAVFDRWRAWRPGHRPGIRADGEYHASDHFRTDFLEFVACKYGAENGPESMAVAAIAEYALEAGGPRPPAVQAPRGPHLAESVRLVHVGTDYNRLIDALRKNLPLGDVPRRPVVLAERQVPGGLFETLQLSPLSAALIELCDGTRTIPDLIALFPTLAGGLDRFPPDAACRFALNELSELGLLAGC